MVIELTEHSVAVMDDPLNENLSVVTLFPFSCCVVNIACQKLPVSSIENYLESLSMVIVFLKYFY